MWVGFMHSEWVKSTSWGFPRKKKFFILETWVSSPLVCPTDFGLQFTPEFIARTTDFGLTNPHHRVGKMLAGPHSHQGLRGRIPSLTFPAFCGSWPSLAFVGLRSHHSVLCLCLHITFSSVYVCLISLQLTLIEILIIGFKVHLNNPDDLLISKSFP